MKRLTILRHASASQGGSSLDDFDRPLNDRGIESARLLGKELKRRGLRFVGPTTAYALMQATGMVDDHVSTCWRARA